MAISVQRRGERFQLRVIHSLLPKPYFSTFDDEESADKYGAQLQGLLDKGVVPTGLLAQKRTNTTPLVDEVIRTYLRRATPAPSDIAVLNMLATDLKELRVGGVTFKWIEDYVKGLKERKLAPGTIRKRVESLARVLDWHRNDTHVPGEPVVANPLRMLPRGYSTYCDAEVVDEARDFRLSEVQARAVRAVLNGVKRDDRERAWPAEPAFVMFYELIFGTGLRLREAYKLRVDQYDTKRGVLNVEGSKGHRGKLKPRVVPLRPELRKQLTAWCKDKVGLMFPFWDGTLEDLDRCTSRLSARFSTLFDYAGVEHLTEHDMRHEAACGWVMLQNTKGQWVFNDTEICRIMGWSDPRMMLRYASLRGEDLADRLAA
ncbi:MAG: site-specific integrase [Variovorax sp.]|nr:MAG: site-specific integrase [Variovorax sp.]